MKNQTVRAATLLLALVMLLLCASCTTTDANGTAAAEEEIAAAEETAETGEAPAEAEENEPSVTCYNGTFIGAVEEDTGVLSFKGIPYAKAPVGELRWKAPEAAEASDETYDAKEYGNSALQYYWFSEDITTDVSEDCLTLNVWTSDLSAAGKPVMVFFHGGSYAWGGTSEPLYNGQYIVAEHPDVIVVTCNYRLGMMGFIDFSTIPGGEEYSDSTQLGLLDAVESLRWIRENIEQFGGDPDNITIFGESAGGGIVSCLLSTEYAGTLFQRVIAESGALNQTSEAGAGVNTVQAETLMELAGAENMDDLLALTEEELIELNETALDEYETCLNDMYSLPMRGGIVPDDPYAALADAKAKGVDFLIGTNEDELNYWIAEMGAKEVTDMTDEELEEALDLFYNEFIEGIYESFIGRISDEERETVEAYIASHTERSEEENKTVLCNDYFFRASSIRMAESYAAAEGDGRGYMYLFCKDHSDASCVGSGHASELAYVFHNLNASGFTGTVDEELADEICSMWVNFAKTGDPSTESSTWTEYGTERSTMIFGNDGSCQMADDPLSEEREVTACLAYLYLESISGV